MKKFLLLLSVIVFSCTTAFAQGGFDKDAFAKNLNKIFADRGTPVDTNIEVLKKLDAPAGYYFLRLTFSKKGEKEVVGEQFMFTDGSFIVQDFMDAKNMDSLSKTLSFEFAPKLNIDVSNLTPIIGKKGAKNVVIEVTDFQCPYCIRANAYLHEKLADKKDVVVYVMHMPLRSIHPTAEILAKVFEAGMLMNKNFMNDLYNEENGQLSEGAIIEKYAKQSGNPETFKKHVASATVIKRVKDAEAQALKLGIKATPVIIVNGKLISGYDVPLYEKALNGIK